MENIQNYIEISLASQIQATAVFCQDFKEMGTDDQSHWKIWRLWSLFSDQIYYTATIDLKFVGTWAPANKITGDIPDSTVLKSPFSGPGISLS